MDVRHVGVRVLERRVDVGMRVRLLRRHAVAVRVPVMLVVDVHVIVLETLVDVRVQVPLAEEQRHSQRHEPAGRAFAQPQALAEQGDGRHRTHERRRREQCGLPSGSEGT